MRKVVVGDAALLASAQVASTGQASGSIKARSGHLCMYLVHDRLRRTPAIQKPLGGGPLCGPRAAVSKLVSGVAVAPIPDTGKAGSCWR